MTCKHCGLSYGMHRADTLRCPDGDNVFTCEYMDCVNNCTKSPAAPAPVENGCLCQDCGWHFKVDFIVPDELWKRIKPTGKPAGAGLLCGHCIISRLEDLGYGAFALSARLLKPTPVGNTLKQLIEDAFVEAKSDEAVIKTLRDILDGYTQATEQRKEN